jgi:20S proteasome alpha/beta subunit
MTLILAAATPHFVVAVADRRLTRPDHTTADDNANKMVMFCNQMAFAYSGMSEIEGQRTVEWLVAQLNWRSCPRRIEQMAS